MANKDDPDDALDQQLFKEVDDDIRRDRYAKLWKKYGNLIVGAVVAVVATTSGIVWWRDYQLGLRGQEGEAYAAALEVARTGKPRDAGKAFMALAGQAGPGYATLARLQAAALRAKRGDTKGAAAIYLAIARDDGVDSVFRDLATLLGVTVSLDTGKPAVLAARIKPLAEAEGPWFFSALELSALIAERAGDIRRAREIYIRLADDAAAPRSLRARARVLRDLLGKS